MTISATSQGLKPGVCTSSNRPANPYDGMMIYETDTNVLAVYDGSSWKTVGDTDFTPFGAWTAYTPSLTSSGTTPNLGSTGYIYGAYKQIGKTVFGRIVLQFSGTGVSAGTGSGYYITLPVTSSVSGYIVGSVFAQDSSTGARQTGVVWLNNTTRVEMFYDGTGGYPTFGSTLPWTWDVSDLLSLDFTYEAA